MKILAFTLSPELSTSKNLREKISNLWEALKFGIAGYLVFTLLLFVDHMLSVYLSYNSIIKQTFGKFDSYLTDLDKAKLALLGIVVVPLVEELAFRSFMNFRRLFVSISMGFFTYIVLSTFIQFSLNQIWIKIITIGSGLFVLLLCFSKIDSDFLTRLKKHYKTFFYISNILFVLLHISNYKTQEFGLVNYLSLPIVLLPQIIASLNFSFIRIKNGLVWSIAFHSFYNCIFFLPRLIE